MDGFDGATSAGDDTTTTAGKSSAIYGGPIMDPGNGVIKIECSVWNQDCAKDEKCTPWANDGGLVWNAARCVLLAEDPVGLGEPCTVEGSYTAGFDTCEAGLTCIGSDEETLEGICMELCSGSEESPVCVDTPEATCVGHDTVIPLCRPTCDPLESNCADGEACLPSFDGWGCMLAGSAALAEPCDSFNACAPGSICLEGEDGSSCAAVCDVTAPEPGCADETTCSAFYEDGTAPAGLDDVGLCL